MVKSRNFSWGNKYNYPAWRDFLRAREPVPGQAAKKQSICDIYVYIFWIRSLFSYLLILYVVPADKAIKNSAV